MEGKVEQVIINLSFVYTYKCKVRMNVPAVSCPVYSVWDGHECFVISVDIYVIVLPVTKYAMNVSVWNSSPHILHYLKIKIQ